MCWDRKLKRWELYDIVADPFERNDLAAKHPAIVEKLTAELDDWWTVAMKRSK